MSTDKVCEKLVSAYRVFGKLKLTDLERKVYDKHFNDAFTSFVKFDRYVNEHKLNNTSGPLSREVLETRIGRIIYKSIDESVSHLQQIYNFYKEKKIEDENFSFVILNALQIHKIAVENAQTE